MPAEIWEYSGVWKEIPDPVCEQLQLLEISAIPLSGEFSMNNHFTLPHSASASPSPPDHRTRVGFRQCFVNTQFLFTRCLLMRRDSQWNFHNTHFRADDNPHITVASGHERRLYQSKFFFFLFFASTDLNNCYYFKFSIVFLGYFNLIPFLCISLINFNTLLDVIRFFIKAAFVAKMYTFFTTYITGLPYYFEILDFVFKIYTTLNSL
jgi:hypothetical protein